MTDILPGGRWPPQAGCPGNGGKLNHPIADLSQERIKRQPVLGGLLIEYERAA